MLKKLKKSDSGFTIIEVMIVLAIAGLIMLIVFLAVPALQRNSRNTARRSDASRVVTSVSNFITNAGGKMPNPASASDIDATSILADAGTFGGYPTLTVFTGGGLPPASNNSKFSIMASTANVTLTSKDNVVVVVGAQCSGTTTSTTGTKRAFAVLYTLESGSGAGFVQACLAS